MKRGRAPYALVPDQFTEVARLYREGWSEFQIADRFGVSRDTVQRALKAMGVPKRSTEEGKQSARRSGWHEWRRNRPTTRTAPAAATLYQAISHWRT